MKHSSICSINKSNKLHKTFVVVGAVFALAVSPMFARGKMSSSGMGMGGGFGPSMSRGDVRYGCEMPEHREMHGMDGHGHGMNACLMGTVKSVDSGKSTVTVSDADGNDFVIHVNPSTRICSIDRSDKGLKEETITRGNKTVTVKRPEVKSIKISDLKKGDWVQVGKFNTNTTVIEASGIVKVEN